MTMAIIYSSFNKVMNSNNGKFLSNAPITQFARISDYGTLSFFNFLSTSDYSFQVGSNTATDKRVEKIQINLKKMKRS